LHNLRRLAAHDLVVKLQASLVHLNTSRRISHLARQALQARNSLILPALLHLLRLLLSPGQLRRPMRL